ncbi:hypothetical protein BASA84_001322 [Batrachochytrium salamandrivorans]|nr:hypothetical protein BASA84_001322 [Batrachochytrium salamandrivorans]
MIVSLFKSLVTHPPIRNSDILDQDFSWNQIAAALLQMSPRKAPGDDEYVVKYSLQQQSLRAWLCASIVSIDKKDGDPLSTQATSEGIALINVGLKLVCKVLQMRIERFVETNNLLSYEQAGFRKRKECVGQVVSLVDIIQRRQNAGLNTHVSIHRYSERHSIQVPVGALLWKLAEHGIPLSYSCISQGIVHIIISSNSSTGRITTIGPIPSTERCQTGMSIVWTTIQSIHQRHSRWCRTQSQSMDYRKTPTPFEDSCTQDDVAVLLTLRQSLLVASDCC